jgi:hypothetical protein
MQEILAERIDNLIVTLETLVPPVQTSSDDKRNNDSVFINAPTYGYMTLSDSEGEGEGCSILALLFLIFSSIYAVAKDDFVRYWLRGIDKKMRNIKELKKVNPAMIGSINKAFVKWRTPYHRYIRIWWYSKISVIISLTGLLVGLVCKLYFPTYIFATLAILSIVNICWKTWTDDVYVYENQHKHNAYLQNVLDKLRVAQDQCKQMDCH